MKKSTPHTTRNPQDTTFTFQLPRELREKIEDHAKKQGHRAGPWIRHFIETYFEDKRSKL